MTRLFIFHVMRSLRLILERSRQGENYQSEQRAEQCHAEAPQPHCYPIAATIQIPAAVVSP